MFKKQKQSFKYLFFVCFFLISFYICFFKLGHSYLENWDEGFYAQVTKEMINKKEPFILYWNNKVFLDKSPLNFWLNSLFVKLFGLSEFSIRLTSAISGFLVIIIITYLSFNWWGLIPTLFSFSAIALNNLFIWRTRTGNLDALLSLLFIISYLLITNKNKKRYLFLGIIFGLIYLQKLTIVLLPLGIFVIHEILKGKNYLKQNFKNYFLVFLFFFLISGSWLYIGWKKIGNDFINYYLFKADQGVGKLSLNFLKIDYINYAYYSLQRRLFYPFLIGTIFLFINIKKIKNLVLLLFSISLLIGLSFTQKNNNWYLVPSMPFWALTIGYGIKKLLDLIKKNTIKKTVSFLLLIPLFYVSYKTFTINIKSIINMESSISEVKTALKTKQISRPNDTILRLDFAYPVTLYYSDRTTYYYVYIDNSLVKLIKEKNIKYLVGKKEKIHQFEEFVKTNNKKIYYKIIDLPDNDEAIIKIIKT